MDTVLTNAKLLAAFSKGNAEQKEVIPAIIARLKKQFERHWTIASAIGGTRKNLIDELFKAANKENYEAVNGLASALLMVVQTDQTLTDAR